MFLSILAFKLKPSSGVGLTFLLVTSVSATLLWILEYFVFQTFGLGVSNPLLATKSLV